MNSNMAFRGFGRILALLVVLAIPLFFGNPAAKAADGPEVVVPSVHITVYRNTYYYPPNAKERVYDTWCWMPDMKFRVLGPIEAGSQLQVDFTKPDGSAWLTLDCPTEQIEAKHHLECETPRGLSEAAEKKYILATGVCGFTIRMKNELAGTNQTLFAGKFKVAKFHKGLTLPKFKNCFEYYVDQDWAMPIGYVWGKDSYQEHKPLLHASLWFKGEANTPQLAGYLFYNGKLIANTKQEGTGGSVDSPVELNTVAADRGDPKWVLWDFTWGQVREYNHGTADPDNDARFYLLDKNPGEYEIKVLREGKLCRSLKFTVGEDGKIVNNGVAAANHLHTTQRVVPVKIIGTQDGAWNTQAWKTEAFYGNPLTGFTAE